MVFSSPLFLFVFLPIVLALYYVLARSCRNILLLIASLIFYAWGEPVYVLLMIGSIFFNWIIGLELGRRKDDRVSRIILAVGVFVNLVVLAHYKYAYFLLSSANNILEPAFGIRFAGQQVPLPVGISFFTFHAISYIVDIYRKEAAPLKNPLDMGVYISLFPQLVAGPIIRYHDIARQIAERTNTLDRFCSGVERFSFGLGKKVLIANVLGNVADQIFAAPENSLSAPMAWLGIACYTLQIYFDFSGYSDMAIGLARMFGFELTENFNYPYIARSIREFWRRWHLSLSTWFRDYLYIPLGGNRASPVRVKVNLFIVFLLCGLWHGASWNFVLWGAFHGMLLVFERGRFGALLDRLPGIVGSAYAILMVMVGWVLFRAADLPQAIAYVGAMLGLGSGSGFSPQVLAAVDARVIWTLVAGVILATPVATVLCRDWATRIYPSHAAEPFPPYVRTIGNLGRKGSTIAISSFISIGTVVLCISQLATSTYNPFIYFRF